MSMYVTSEQFHPMRGHVDHGVVVAFPDGSRLTVVNAVSTGWNLVDSDGVVVAAADGAHDLTAAVVRLAGERA